MFVSDCLNLNENGHLTIGDMDTVALAKQYGTPLYVLDEQQIRFHCRSFRQSMERYYDGKGLVAFASKAFCCKRMCQIVKEEGLGLDVVSGGEIHTALSAGMEPEKMFFHGNNKTIEELSMAVEHHIGIVVVDNLTELALLNQIAKSAGVTVSVLLRIKPGIDAHTHNFIRTGQIDSKFGFALETGEAMEAVKAAEEMSHIDLKGLHCHIGSQIFDISPFELAAQVMMNLLLQIKETIGRELEILNLGGGFGIQYVEEHDPKPYSEFMARVSKTVRSFCETHQIHQPFIVIEPGRSIVGPAGITLYHVGGIKKIPGIRTYVSVDGGMTDNPRYALYQSEYEAIIANKASQPKAVAVTIAGKCCESGDLLGENIPLQEPEIGDVLAVFSTGAYNYSMSSHYNRIPKPAVVMVSNGQSYLAVRRETYDDLIRCDV